MKLKDMLLFVLLSCERSDENSLHLRGHLLFKAEHHLPAVHWARNGAGVDQTAEKWQNSVCLSNYSMAAVQEGPGFTFPRVELARRFPPHTPGTWRCSRCLLQLKTRVLGEPETLIHLSGGMACDQGVLLPLRR